MSKSNETVLQFGTGMLLRAICATAVDTANRAGYFNGRIVVVQSTAHGAADVLNRQHGAFTLVERGIEAGVPVERSRRIESISRVLVARSEWGAIREVISRPEVRVIVSNVTEAGFRLDEPELPAAPGAAPDSFPAKLADLLDARFGALPDAPTLFVIPTELVPDNGPRLAAMVDTLVQRRPNANQLRAWIAQRVRFCSSLVDRITTSGPVESTDELITVTEPHSLWAIECDPGELRGAFPIEAASNGSVIFAPDIGLYRERKLRLLNGAHTSLAPLALFAGLRTVHDATADPGLGQLLRQILLDEIGPSTMLSREAATTYAQSVLDRFSNPWLEHEWRVIATNQTAKLRVRVIPSIVAFTQRYGRVPPGLVQALAASLRYARTVHRDGAPIGEGWWRGSSYRIVDVDLEMIDRHWRVADPSARAGLIPESAIQQFARSVVADESIWGFDLTYLTGDVTRELIALERSSS